MATSRIKIIEETGSTNADLAAALRSSEPPANGSWLVARRQTAGRGRQGREWFDGSGNFMGSAIVAVDSDNPAPASVSFVAALAVAQAIDLTLDGVCRPRLKWPNDVLLDGGKVSGILLEMVGKHVVVGIGVNLACAPQLDDRKTASIADHGPAPDLETFAETLADVFERYLAEWRNDGLTQVLRGFLHNSDHFSGDPITVHDTDGSRIEGNFIGLDPSDGALKLRLADGSERVIRAGDIS